MADAPGTTALGIDGIVLHGRDIIAVQNGMMPARIARFSIDTTGLRIERVTTVDRHARVADEPTIGTLLGDSFLYVANSQWEKYDAHGQRIHGTSLSRPVILQLPLSADSPARSRDPLHLRTRDLLRRALRGGRGEPRRQHDRRERATTVEALQNDACLRRVVEPLQARPQVGESDTGPMSRDRSHR